MNILGIETSCDETAVAIVSNKGDSYFSPKSNCPQAQKPEILANLVLSQLKEHEAFGGVVPEIAARAHLDHLDTLIRAAMQEAGISFDDLDGIAATCGPGLIGGVMVGMMAGKAMAAARGLPFIAVNHLEGHALTPRLTDAIEFPYLLLLVSGGHTQILVAEGVGQYKLWGTTLDDACGECFDKSAKLMGLPYPGGPHVESIAAQCVDPEKALERFPLPRPMKGRKELDFSFSGLKTAVRTHVEALPPGDLQEKDIADLAYALQTAIADVLVDRCGRAMERFFDEYSSSSTPPQDSQNKPPSSDFILHNASPGRSECSSYRNAEHRNTGVNAPTLVVSGGVAANTKIRDALQNLCDEKQAKLYAPPLELCGDNAAMIAWAGLERLQRGMSDSLDFKAKPRWPLDQSA